jgi:glycine/D-amino acid oxidase-like deaminating enzyme
MLNAPATGLALAELITGGAAKVVDLSDFDPARQRL